jgi:hypothetical protein
MLRKIMLPLMIILIPLAVIIVTTDLSKKDPNADDLKAQIHTAQMERFNAEARSLSLSVAYDSLYTAHQEQKILIRFTAEKCKKYAKIVKRDPSQSVFITNWIERSFQWTEELK